MTISNRAPPQNGPSLKTTVIITISAPNSVKKGSPEGALGGTLGGQKGVREGTLFSDAQIGRFSFFFMKILIFHDTSEKWWNSSVISIVNTLRFKSENHVFLNI